MALEIIYVALENAHIINLVFSSVAIIAWKIIFINIYLVIISYFYDQTCNQDINFVFELDFKLICGMFSGREPVQGSELLDAVSADAGRRRAVRLPPGLCAEQKRARLRQQLLDGALPLSAHV